MISKSPKKTLVRIEAAMLLLLILTFGLVAGTMAQSDELFVTVIRVDSEAFPQVTTLIAVSDENGDPLAGLTQTHFEVTDETGRPLTLTAIESVDSLSLSVALVLDVSMPGESFAEVQKAALALLDTLGPQDKVALFVLYDEMQVLHEFTDNFEILKATVQGMEIEGNFTTLHQVAIEAAAATEKISSGRKAVVILTNHRDNVGQRSAESAINYARAVGVPLFTIGFGRAYQADPFEEMVKRTGGGSILLSEPEEMRDALQTLAKRLRQGYRVTFQSKLEADGAEHEFFARVAHGGRAGQAGGRLVALSGSVTVIPPDIAAGPIAGVVRLSAQVTAPSPVVSVQYLMDGQSLGELTAPPYRLDWDSSTVEPGSHTLTIKAVDSAGNVGEATTSLHVAGPPQVKISVRPEKATLGEEVFIEAEIEAATEATGVNFLLDGKALGSDDAPPYTLRLTLDSAEHSAGEHILTVQAKNNLGQQGETSRVWQFLAPPSPPPPPPRTNWQEQLIMTALIIITIWALIVGCFLILRRFFRAQRRRYQRELYVQVSNQGNVRSAYELRVGEPTGGLAFQFGLEGAPLQWQQVGASVVGPGPAAPTVTGEGDASVAAAPSTLKKDKTGKTRGQNPLGTFRQTQEKSRAVLSLGGIAASVLQLFGALLPGRLGAPFKKTAQGLRRGQAQVGGVIRTPDHKIGVARRLSNKTSQFRPGSRASSQGQPYQPTSRHQGATRTTPYRPGETGTDAGRRLSSIKLPSFGGRVASKPATSLVSDSLAGGSRSEQIAPDAPGGDEGSQTSPDAVHHWAQTPALGPGETLTLDLLINPADPYQNRHYAFEIVSRQLELEDDAAGLTAPESVVEMGTIQIVGASRWGRLLSIVMALGVILLTGWYAVAQALWLLRFLSG